MRPGFLEPRTGNGLKGRPKSSDCTIDAHSSLGRAQSLLGKRCGRRCDVSVRFSVVDDGMVMLQPAQWAYGGGFPIWIKGCPSAAYAVIVVSGLAQADDHQCKQNWSFI